MMLGRVLGVSPGCQLQHYHRMHDTWAKRFSGTEESERGTMKDWCCGNLIIVRD
jgi:hypothetical protein